MKYILYLVFLFGIYGAGTLAFREFSHGTICPTIASVPACYIILACLIVPFIVHVFNKGNSIYFAFTGLALSIATYGSIMQFFGAVECPKTGGGTPMCYLSFMLFATLVLVKAIELKKRTSTV